jgi:hypothetical protein
VLLAKSAETGELIEPLPGSRAICPQCEEPVLAKCGAIVSWHWAHLAGNDCDSWSEGETEWHLTWKRAMPQCEVVMERDGIKHRADAVTWSGFVVEFQHSPISVSEIKAREEFYENMVWVFDVSDKVKKGLFDVRLTAQGDQFLARWNREPKTIAACTRPVYLDIGCGILLKWKKQLDNLKYVIVDCSTHDVFVYWARGWEWPYKKKATAKEVYALYRGIVKDYPKTKTINLETGRISEKYAIEPPAFWAIVNNLIGAVCTTANQQEDI